MSLDTAEFAAYDPQVRLLQLAEIVRPDGGGVAVTGLIGDRM